MRKIFLVTFENMSIPLDLVCKALYLAESKLDISTDETYLSLTCYVKPYRADSFVAAVKLAGGICTEYC